LLSVTVGLPYFVASATSSLVQAWYARTHSGVVPYRLFALSNLASMLALVTYPVLVEPALTTRLQANLWSIGYGCFVVLCATTSWLAARSRPPKVFAGEGQEDIPPPPLRSCVLWVTLAACASILLLAMTSFLTQDVAAIPFLWVLPLAVYLLTFILCFDAPRWYNRGVFIPLTIVGLGAAAYRLQPDGWKLHMIATIGVFSAALFVFCMFCHGELTRLKPHPRYLTGFYVMISLGGALGGVFVGLIAPNFFNAYYEFPIGLCLCAALIAILMPRPSWGKFWKPALAALFIGYAIYLGKGVSEGVRGYRLIERNFYGQLRVDQDGEPSEEDSYRVLLNGLINHGEQMRNEKYRRTPVTYYCQESGIGKVMSARPAVPQIVGLIGMGCGTLAAYGRSGDTYRIYEINPLVPPIADTQFTFLKDSPAKVEIVLGDARLSLEQEPDQTFDLLVMDAFSGDSVPVHLITREALAMYFQRLKPGGLLAVHISNNYLDLLPVMERAAAYFGKIAILYKLSPKDDDFLCFPSSWVVVADASLRQTMPDLAKAGRILSPYPVFHLWTDDFSSMWGILR
jgi:spermidine synthase